MRWRSGLGSGLHGAHLIRVIPGRQRGRPTAALRLGDMHPSTSQAMVRDGGQQEAP